MTKLPTGGLMLGTLPQLGHASTTEGLEQRIELVIFSAKDLFFSELKRCLNFDVFVYALTQVTGLF